MSFDNKIFNVNGKTKDMLRITLNLVFNQNSSNTTAKTWTVHPKKGIVLYWADCKNTMNFMTPLNADAVTDSVWEWLQSPAANDIVLIDEDDDIDFDGSTDKGWRVYLADTSDDGYDPNNFFMICAITPVYLWYSK